MYYKRWFPFDQLFHLNGNGFTLTDKLEGYILNTDNDFKVMRKIDNFKIKVGGGETLKK